MDDTPDVLDRNDALNKKIEDFSTTYTRRSVVDTFLVVLVILAAVALVLTLLYFAHLENVTNQRSDEEIQLICQTFDHPDKYAVCDQLGPPNLEKERR